MRTFKYLVASVLLAMPMAAMASGGGKGLGALIEPSPGSMLWTLLTFIILLIVLGKFAWGPIIKGLEAREEKIYGAIDKAQKDRDEAEKILKEYQEKLDTASAEISQKLSGADKEAKKRVEQAKEQAREEGEKLIARAQQEIEAQKEKVSADLRREVAELAASVAGAAIGESFQKEDQLRIIRKRLEQVEKPS